MLPILFSFRRCPYAMRARIGMALSGIDYILREVDLKNKPDALYAVSPKATVPVLIAHDLIIDESLEIINWLSGAEILKQQSSLKEVAKNLNNSFIPILNQFKYPNRFENALSKDDCVVFLQDYLHIINNQVASLDYSFYYEDEVVIFPFIRQLRIADELWFNSLGLKELYSWVSRWDKIIDEHNIMAKYPVWNSDDSAVVINNTRA